MSSLLVDSFFDEYWQVWDDCAWAMSRDLRGQCMKLLNTTEFAHPASKKLLNTTGHNPMNLEK